jgi:hypothetical protein
MDKKHAIIRLCGQPESLITAAVLKAQSAKEKLQIQGPLLRRTTSQFNSAAIAIHRTHRISLIIGVT